MPATNTQLIGGAFQDSKGNVLANGYLLLKLNQDNSVSGVGNIAAGVEVKITLNSSGSVDTSTPQYIWATDVMTTPNAFYRVTGYTAAGQPAWGPNNQQVTSGGVGGGTFDTGLWVPNVVFSWTPATQPLLLQTNGTRNSSQTLLNIAAGANLSATEVNGTVTLAVTGSGIVLQTNGTPNGSQSKLNLVAGTGVGIVDDGTGDITISASGGGGGILGLWPGNWCGLTIQASPSGSTFPGAVNTNPGQIQSGYPVVIVPPTATVPRGAKIQASGLTNSSGIADQVNFLTPGIVRDWFMKGAIDGTTSSRYWIGMVDTAFANIPTTINSDAPAANIIGFRWSSGTDVNFKAVCQTDAAHQTVVDTGVAVVADAIHTFEIVPQGGGSSVKFYIDGVQVANISTNVPANTTAMTWCFTVDGKGSGTTNFNFIFYYFNCLVAS